MRNYPDRHLVQYILCRIRDGFRIGFSREHKCIRANGNMISAIRNPQPVGDFMQTEVKAGRVVVSLPDIPNIQISTETRPTWKMVIDP